MADITCKNCGTLINLKNAQKGVVICPNCEVENDCSEQIYERATELMASANNEVSYKAAAEAFSLIEGYSDADMYRDNCLEQADICFKDATFLRAKTEMMKGDRAGLSFACHLLESISGWKDADEQLGICRMRLEAVSGKEKDNTFDPIYSDSNKGFVKKDRKAGGSHTRVKNSTDAPAARTYVDFPSLRGVRESEINNEKTASEKKQKKSGSGKKKLTKIIIALCVGLILIGALAGAYFIVIEPMLRYDKAVELIENGEYTEGYAILTELGRDDEILSNKKERAHALLEKEDFDKAYALMEETGEEDKIVDNILGRVTPLVAEGKYIDAVKLLEKYKYGSLPEKRYKRAAELVDSAEYNEAYILLNGNSYTGSDEKKNSINNITPEIRFLGRKKGDIVEFGNFEIDGNLENGKEVVVWKIIDETDDAYLLLSESIIDCIQFDGPNENINWTQSYVRKVLNLSHLNGMFGEKEKGAILEKNVVASKNPAYDTDPGTDSISSLFLLSCDEVTRLLTDPSSRIVSSKRYEESPNGLNWWLRTPGATSGNIVYVNQEGNMILEGAPANVPFLIRPALWVKKIA